VGPTATQANSYWYDDTHGATTLTVPTLHALDTVTHALGDFTGVTADLVRRRDRVPSRQPALGNQRHSRRPPAHRRQRQLPDSRPKHLRRPKR
jgi:hypothetical protein